MLADQRDMNSERTHAYGRVVRTLQDVGPTKLHDSEQERIRDAADTLIFAATYDEARRTLEDVEALTEQLVDSGRWSEERAAELASDLMACGPVAPVG
jgi:hypothetical protein